QDNEFRLSELSSIRICYDVAKSNQANGFCTMYFSSLPGHSFNQFDVIDYSFSLDNQSQVQDSDITYHKSVVVMIISAVSEATDLIGADLGFEENVRKGNIAKALSSIKDFIAF
ncbi:MAG: hypothetical protein AB3N14_09390, partial [Flavobacteriaceae bacterium]